MDIMKDKYDIGVIVGRFQVAELSEAHKNLINSVINNHKQCIVVIGVSPTLGTKQNPLSYTTRMKMIQSDFSDVMVSYLMDKPSNKEWSMDLDSLIRVICPLGSICLYGGRDSFISSYKGINPTFETAVIHPHVGTKIREDIGKEVLNSINFRKGIIYASQNQYPRVFPTIDIAVTKKEGKNIEVLLARRKENDLLQFPGGFVDPKDLSLEETAKREISEELDVNCEGRANYICSSLINDWRYSNTSEKILTSLFQLEYSFGTGNPIDEFHSSEWIILSKNNINLIKENHKILFEHLLKYYKRR